jgi:hypothetical protein
MTAVGAMATWFTLALTGGAEATFVESVDTHLTDARLVVDVKADGAVDPGFVTTKRSSSWFTIYVEGLRVRPDNRAWSSAAPESIPVEAHRHSRRIELKMRLPEGATCGETARVRSVEGVLRIELPCGAAAASNPDVSADPIAALPTVREAAYHPPAPEPATAPKPAATPEPAAAPKPAAVTSAPELAPTPEPAAVAAHAPKPAGTSEEKVTSATRAASAPVPQPAVITAPTPTGGLGWGYAVLSAVLLLGGVGLLFREPIALRLREWTADGGITTLFHPLAAKMGGGHIKILEKKTISPNRVLVLAEIDGERILLADTEAGLELLSAKPDPEPLQIKTPAVVLNAAQGGQEIPAVKPTPPERLALENQVLDVLFGASSAVGGKR